MRLFVLGAVCCLLLGLNASAQIVTGTPRPDISDKTLGTIKTLDNVSAFELSADSALVPRIGALLFASFDNNGDYTIDKSEVRAGIEVAFTSADIDKSKLLSLVELEAWRTRALGSENAMPHNFAFAPNFARSVSREKFTSVLQDIANQLDRDPQGIMDGKISMANLLEPYMVPNTRHEDEKNCKARLREVRQRAQQDCQTRRGR
ncbi:MAG: hypothetical protein V3U57_07480 [Robiginitomaculum sp.]